MRLPRILPVIAGMSTWPLSAATQGTEPAPAPRQSSVQHAPSGEHVILLHGMCRTSRSMTRMERSLRENGFTVSNIDYPSRSASIEELSECVVSRAIDACEHNGATRIHFVTHSLGGILVRSYLDRHKLPKLGHVVMLGPPNQGSEVVDRIGHWKIFGLINGPSGRELGTGCDSTPNRLGAAQFPVGVIAGNRSINWINSTLIPGADDGKVSTERTRLAGMKDHVVIPTTHPFMMKNRKVIHQTLAFLRHGRFERA